MARYPHALALGLLGPPPRATPIDRVEDLAARVRLVVLRHPNASHSSNRPGEEP